MAVGNIGAMVAIGGLSVLGVLGTSPASASPASASPASDGLASATPASRPHGCAIAYFRSACAAPIENRTEGFAAAGRTSLSSGFPFSFVEWSKEGYGYDAAHSEAILPDGTGFAYSRNTGGFLTGVEGTYVYEVGGLLGGHGNSTVRIYMYTPDYGTNHASCTNGNYVYCRLGAQMGPRADPYWPVTLTTRPVVVRIDNFVNQPLRLEGRVSRANVVLDPAGDSNVDKIPADTSGQTGVATIGGLLAVDEPAAIGVAYRVLPGGSGEFDGASVNIHLAIPLTGKSEGSTCEVANRSSSGVLRCDVLPLHVPEGGEVRATVVIR